MIRRAVFWVFTGQIATFIFSFAGSIVVSRLLSPRELGIFAVAAAALGILQIISSFGVSAFVIREVDLTKSTLDTAFTVNALLSLGLSTLVLVVSYPTALFLKEPAVTPILQWLAVTPLLGILEFRPTTMLQREMQFRLISLVAVARSAASVIATVAAAISGASYMSPAYGSIVAGLVGLLGTLTIGRKYWSLAVSLAGWRPMAKFGVQIMSVSGVAVAAVRLSDIIMGRLLGVATLGLYSRASNLSNLVFSNIYGTATRVVFAKLATDVRERGVVRDAFLPGLRMITGVMGPILIGIAVLSKPLIHLLYGTHWVGAAPVLSLLMIAQFISLTFAMNWELFVVRDQLGLQTKFEISRSVFGLVSQTIGCLISMIAAAASSIVDAIFSLLLYAPHMRRLADAESGELTGIYLECCVLTFVTTSPVLVVMFLYGWSATTPLTYLLLGIAAGSVAWLLMLVKLGHPLWFEIIYLFRKGRSRIRGELRSESAV